jgi:hypothetical protein
VIKFIDEVILHALSNYSKNSSVLKLSIKRIKRFLFTNLNIINILIKEFIINESYQAALDLTSEFLDPENRSKYGTNTTYHD